MRSSIFRRAMVAGSAVAIAAMLSGCLSGGSTKSESKAGQGASAIESAAKKDGSLTWYSSLPQATNDAVTAAFTAKYGITVQTTVLTSGLLTTRYSSEQAAGQTQADLVTAADPLFFKDAVTKKWLAKLTETDLPSIGSWPKTAFISDSYALVNIQPIGISYNTSTVTTVPKDWKDLLTPAFKGKIELVDPTNVVSWLDLFRVLDEKLGDSYFSSLMAQNPEFVDSSVPGAQRVAAGAGSIVFPSLLTVSKPLKDKGAPIDTIFLSPTTGVQQYTGVSTNATHPNAARLFLNYLLSRDAQAILNKDTGSSPLSGIPGTVPLPAGYVTPDIEKTQADRKRLLALVGK